MLHPSAASRCNFKYSKAAQGPTTLVIVSALVPATAPHCRQDVLSLQVLFLVLKPTSFFDFFLILPQLDVRLAKIHKEGRWRLKKFYEVHQ
jgi:hypothetical protein